MDFRVFTLKITLGKILFLSSKAQKGKDQSLTEQCSETGAEKYLAEAKAHLGELKVTSSHQAVYSPPLSWLKNNFLKSTSYLSHIKLFLH